MLGTFDSPSPLGIGLAIVVGVGAVVIHVCLTRRNPWWLGAIMPVAWVLGAAAIAATRSTALADLRDDAIIVVMLLFLWWVNGDARARRRRSPAD
ncbi:hypothetical protein [Brevibacterium gallinarum]|uniref:Uncharacterized protein n=1 Tax=Brevibacterium gallinarum TaxID=2762220 RepID=A0ABR8WUK1_9MICO|nr:hypothetical protein [Brevibacterium gallinarum]MBD8020643.1 hypothetical protein [Brevibacterium gallinarum]